MDSKKSSKAHPESSKNVPTGFLDFLSFRTLASKIWYSPLANSLRNSENGENVIVTEISRSEKKSRPYYRIGHRKIYKTSGWNKFDRLTPASIHFCSSLCFVCYLSAERKFRFLACEIPSQSSHASLNFVLTRHRDEVQVGRSGKFLARISKT